MYIGACVIGADGNVTDIIDMYEADLPGYERAIFKIMFDEFVPFLRGTKFNFDDFVEQVTTVHDKEFIETINGKSILQTEDEIAYNATVSADRKGWHTIVKYLLNI